MLFVAFNYHVRDEFETNTSDIASMIVAPLEAMALAEARDPG